MISFPRTMRMVIMILERRKTEIAFVAWKMQVMKMAKDCSSNGVYAFLKDSAAVI